MKVESWEIPPEEDKNISELEIDNQEVFDAVSFYNYDATKIVRVEWTEKHFIAHFKDGLCLVFNNELILIKRFMEESCSL